MNALPYIEPDRDLNLNLCIALIIIDKLAESKKGNKILTVDRAQIYVHLALRPKILNDALLRLGKKQISLREDEYYNVNAVSNNSDFFFDRKLIKKIIALIGSIGFLKIDYLEKEGFVLSLTSEGKNYVENLNQPYFIDIKRYSEHMTSLQSVSNNNLIGSINAIYGEI